LGDERQDLVVEGTPEPLSEEDFEGLLMAPDRWPMLLLLEKIEELAPEVLRDLRDHVLTPHFLDLSPEDMFESDLGRYEEYLVLGRDLSLWEKAGKFDERLWPKAKALHDWGKQAHLLDDSFPTRFKRRVMFEAHLTLSRWCADHHGDDVPKGELPLQWGFQWELGYWRDLEESGTLRPVRYTRELEFFWDPGSGLEFAEVSADIKGRFQSMLKEFEERCRGCGVAQGLREFKRRRGVTERHFEWLVLVHILEKAPADVSVKFGELEPGRDLTVEAIYKGVKRAAGHLGIPPSAVRKGTPGPKRQRNS
jgi:hypothetical protein